MGAEGDTTTPLLRSAAHENIDHNLTNHPPTEAQAARMESVRTLGKALAHHLVDTCEPGRELSIALSGVEQAVMFGVAAIAREHVIR